MYLISAYFDDKTNKILNRYISQIADRSGNTFMTDNNVPPHMTVSQIEARSADVLIPCVEELRNRLEQGTIQFVSVGMLLPYVVYATPVLNEYLMELSGKVYEAVADIDEVAVSRYYKPMSWLPHVTLGKTLDSSQMRTAIEVMQKCFTPFETQIVSVGLARVNPHEDIMRFTLK